jgi:hypothetical protein
MEIDMSATGEAKKPLTITATALALLIGWGLPPIPAQAQGPLADADIRTHVAKALLFDRIDLRIG